MLDKLCSNKFIFMCVRGLSRSNILVSNMTCASLENDKKYSGRNEISSLWKQNMSITPFLLIGIVWNHIFNYVRISVYITYCKYMRHKHLAIPIHKRGYNKHHHANPQSFFIFWGGRYVICLWCKKAHMHTELRYGKTVWFLCFLYTELWQRFMRQFHCHSFIE